MSEENVGIVRRMLESWNRRDFPSAQRSIDPEIVCTVAGQTDFDGTYRGLDGVAEMLRGFWGEFEGGRTEIEEIVPVDGDVVVGVRLRGRGRTSGAEIDQPLWHVWRLREGKAVRWWIFRTKEAALDAARVSE